MIPSFHIPPLLQGHIAILLSHFSCSRRSYLYLVVNLLTRSIPNPSINTFSESHVIVFSSVIFLQYISVWYLGSKCTFIAPASASPLGHNQLAMLLTKVLSLHHPNCSPPPHYGIIEVAKPNTTPLCSHVHSAMI